MKSATSLQETVMFSSLLHWSHAWGSVGRIKKKDETLGGKTASGIVAWSL
jgi:hypothetical protein